MTFKAGRAPLFRGKLHSAQALAGSVFAIFALQSSAAEAAPVCPLPGTPTVCAGRSVGDILVTLHDPSALILGLNPGTGAYYIFSSALTNSGEQVDIAAEPSNPGHTLLIGDVDGFETGISEFDECGNIIKRVWGQFVDVPALHIFHAGTNNRGIAFSPTSGEVWSPGDNNFLFSFPEAGGTAQVASATGVFARGTVNGAVAFDELGNMYVGDESSALIVKYTAATLATSSPIGVALATTGPSITTIHQIAYDGNGNLFVAGMAGAPGPSGVWKINIATGITTLFADTVTIPVGAVLANTPFNSAQGLTIDANGDLWLVQTAAPIPQYLGLTKISGATGQTLGVFTLPASIGGVPINQDLQSDSVYGVNLPATRKACTPQVPTLGDAVDATTGSVSVNPPTLVDSYLSCKGAYGGSNVSSAGNVQAGTTITVNSGARVHGALAPRSPLPATPFAPPAGLVSRGDLNVGSLVTLAAGDYLYRNININSGGSLVGSGGLVRIWYTGGLNIGGNITATGNLPANLWFFGEAGSGSVNVNSTFTVTAVIDAPTAPSVGLNPSSVIFGALVGGGQVNLNGGAVHFDTALAGITCP